MNYFTDSLKDSIWSKRKLFLINDRQITHDSGAQLETEKCKSRE